MDESTAGNRRLRLAGLAAFGSMAAMRVCDPMLVTLAAEFQRTVGETSHVISAFAIAYGLLQLFYGPLGDRIGKLRVIALATAGCAVTAALGAVAPSLDTLVAARALMGATAAGIVPMTMAWIGDSVPYAQRQETMARLLGATVGGMIAGQWFGAWITDTLGWRAAFWALMVVFGVAAWLLHREDARQPRPPVETPEVAAAGAPRFWFAKPLALLREPRVRWVLGVTAVEGAMVFGTLAFVPSQLIQRFGMSTTAAGGILALYGLGGLIYSRTARHLLRVLGERGLVLTGGGLLGASLAVLAWTGDWRATLPACLLAGVGFYMLHATLQIQATQMSPTHRGSAVSLFSCSLFFGQSVGLTAVAWAVDHGWAQGAFSLAGGVLTVLGVVVSRGVATRVSQTVLPR